MGFGTIKGRERRREEKKNWVGKKGLKANTRLRERPWDRGRTEGGSKQLGMGCTWPQDCDPATQPW